MSQINPIQHYGIKEFAQVSDSCEAYAEELGINGFAVIPNIISENTLAIMRAKLDDIYHLQEQEVDSLGNLNTINDANVARGLLAYDDIFLGLATTPIFLELTTKMLGDRFILQMQNGIINRQNQQHTQGSWHRDLNYQHFVSSRPLAIAFLLCVDVFSEETGGTYVLPGTHKIEPFPSQQFVHKHQQCIKAQPGSVLVMDAMLFHRAGKNTGTSSRRAVNHVYCLPFIKQQISLPQLLQGKYSTDTSLNHLLGYAYEPGASVSDWRSRKFDSYTLSK